MVNEVFETNLKLSKMNKFEHAEGLIRQLPIDHDGRNTWLLNYSESEVATYMRERHPNKPRYIPLVREAEKAGTDKIRIKNLCQIEMLVKMKMAIRFGKKFMGVDVRPAAFILNLSGALILKMLHEYDPYVLKEDYFKKLDEEGVPE